MESYSTNRMANLLRRMIFTAFHGTGRAANLALDAPIVPKERRLVRSEVQLVAVDFGHAADRLPFRRSQPIAPIVNRSDRAPGPLCCCFRLQLQHEPIFRRLPMIRARMFRLMSLL